MQQVPEQAKPVTVPAGDSTETAALFAEIKALVGTAAATEPAQCKKIGFGHKPCGGQQRLGLVSDCAVVPEPGVALVGGFCVASGNGDAF